MIPMVKFGKNGIVIDGKEMPFYSGSFHYWRSNREDWEKILDNIKSLGFDIVETYIPWGVHEPEKGKYDFGKLDKRKDLNAFLELCREKELWVIVRPGPHINAEMTCFGYPEWIVSDPEIQARTAAGTPVVYPHVARPFAIPSYASRKLYEETGKYFAVLAPILKKHAYPAGNIIAVQAENETCYFFRDRPYVMDYSEDSAELYRSFLKEKYILPEKMSEAYKMPDANFDTIAPPAGYSETEGYSMEYYYDWAEYKEYQILYALGRIADMIGHMDLSLPVFHNCAYQTYTPVSVQRIERLEGIDVAGIDAYPETGDTKMLKNRIRYLAGSSKMPFVPEFGCGRWFDCETVPSAREEEFGYLYAFMNGMKAVNFYMLVERDRWTGCPIANDGRVREAYADVFQRLMQMMKREEIWRYSRSAKVLVLKNYDMGRLKACLSGMDPDTLSSNLFVKGPDIPWQLFQKQPPEGIEADRAENTYEEEWILEVCRGLDALHIEYDISDCYVEREKLWGYSCVFASSYRQMGEAYQKLLLDYASETGHRLVIGPSVPEEDRRGRKFSLLKDEIGGKNPVNGIKKAAADGIKVLNDVSKSGGLLQKYAGEYAGCGYLPEDDRIEVSVHRRGNHEIIWLANKSDQTVKTEIRFKGHKKFINIWNGWDLDGTGSTDILMPPFTVSLWKVEVEKDD